MILLIALGVVYLQGFLYTVLFPWTLGTAMSQYIKLLFCFFGLFATATQIGLYNAPHSLYSEDETLVQLLGLTIIIRMFQRMFQHIFLAWRLWTLGMKRQDAWVCGIIYILYFISEIAFVIFVTNGRPVNIGIEVTTILRSMLAIILLFYTTYRTSFILYQLETKSSSKLVNTSGSLLKFHAIWNCIRAFIFFCDNIWVLFAHFPANDSTFDLLTDIFDILVGYIVPFDPEFVHKPLKGHVLNNESATKQYGPKIIITKNHHNYLSWINSVIEITDQLPEVSTSQTSSIEVKEFQQSSTEQNEQPNVV